MPRKRFALIALALVAALFLSSCLPGDGKSSAEKPAGFWTGIWHGWVAPISLVAHFFNKSIRVYETANSGWWYDFGFYLAITAGFGGLAFSARARRKRD